MSSHVFDAEAAAEPLRSSLPFTGIPGLDPRRCRRGRAPPGLNPFLPDLPDERLPSQSGPEVDDRKLGRPAASRDRGAAEVWRDDDVMEPVQLVVSR